MISALLCWSALNSRAGPPPVITQQPVDQTVPNRGNASFSVSATSGTTLSYQWHFGSNAISGASSSVLNLTNVSWASQGSYYVAVQNASGTVNSSPATLTVTNVPPIANNDFYTVSENQPLIIAAPGILVNDTDLNGDTLTAVLVSSVSHGTLTFSASGAFAYAPATNYVGTDGFTYVANDGLSNSGVATVTLRVMMPAAITTQPADQSVYSGQNATFTVAAVGTAPLSYQWFYNGASLPGATNSSLIWSNAQTTNSGTVNVMVSNAVASVTSSAASLQVIDSTFHLVQHWMTQYASTANKTAFAQATAVDNAGNVYVTGYANQLASGNNDYVTLKYDANGNLLWVADYDSGSGNDQAAALAVDGGGNVYVTGASQGSGTGWDYGTVKYDSGGNQLWVARYNGAGNKDDQATAIAVDTNGNVFVTGWSKNAAGHNTYATVKYDGSGNQLWVNSYVGPGAAEDDAASIAVDSAGNSYVTGKSRGNGTDFDYATIKYATNGAQLWVARYNGPGNHADSAVQVLVDSEGNSYVTGSSINLNNNNGYATVKYDPNGNQLWVARYDGPGGKNNSAAALALDAFGNVFVTGAAASTNTPGANYATLKYGPAGQQLWVQLYDNSQDDQATALALDPAGDVYVTGKSQGPGTGYDIAMVKYRTLDGTQMGVNRFNSSGGVNDIGVAIAIDSSYNVYVAGQGFNPLDYILLKYQSSFLLPVAVIQPATSLTTTSVVLNASVNSEGALTTCYFQYGTTTNYGALSPSSTLPPGVSPVAVPVAGLTIGSVYHYSLVASNAAGMYVTQDATFSTIPSPVQLEWALVGTPPQMRLSVSSTPGTVFTVVTSPDVGLPMSQWIVVGPMSEIAPGQYELTDPRPATDPQRYYRVW